MNPVLFWKLAAERLYYIIDWQIKLLVSLAVLKVLRVCVLRQVCIEFNCNDLLATWVKLVADWGRVRNEVDSFPSGRIKDFIVSSDILETSSKSY